MSKFLITASVFNKNGLLLSSSQNSYTKTHPLQARFASNTGRCDRIFLHAEIAALLKVRKGSKPYKIVVERYHKDGTPALAKPCVICEQAIKQWGIKRVEYTI